MEKDEFEDAVDAVISDVGIEELLQSMGITELEAFMILYNTGMVDEELFERMYL